MKIIVRVLQEYTCLQRRLKSYNEGREYDLQAKQTNLFLGGEGFMKSTKIIAYLTALLVTLSLLAGCGGAEGKTKTTVETSGSATQTQQTQQNSEPVTVTFFIQQSTIDQVLGKVKEEAEKDLKNIKVEFNVLPTDDADFLKMDVALMSGDTTDVVYLPNPNYQSKYSKAKLLTPLNEMAKEANIDLDMSFGKNIERYENNNVYYLPVEQSLNVVYYNKKIFDDAKVPYPSGNWTWDEYTDIATKLTNTSKGVYGSLMQYGIGWEYYLYIQPVQRHIPAFKEDGTSNFDDPAWKDAMKWNYDLGNKLKVQPSQIDFLSQKIQWDAFMTGKYGMQMIGSWFTSVAADYKTYPRDWNIGICAPPGAADGKSMLASPTCFGINRNAKHPKEALVLLDYVSKAYYKYSGGMPSRVDVNAADYEKLFKSTSDSLKGEVTVEELKKTFVDNGMGIVSEKIIGAASAQINDNIVKQAEKYMIGKQSIDETMNNIKQESDKLISKVAEDSK